MANVTVVVRVVTDDLTPAPVDDVLVRVYSDADVFITEGLTGNPTPGSGEVEFTLNGDSPAVDYILRLSKDGLSFPPAATKSIAVNDPPVPANDFEFSSHDGATAQVVTLVVKDSQLVPVVVEGVKIWVFDSADQYVTEGGTDSNGELELALEGVADPGQKYIARMRKPGYSFPTGATQEFYVHDPLVAPNTNTFDFTALAHDIPESVDPYYCTLSGYLIDVSGRPAANRTIRLIQRKGWPSTSVGSPFPGDPSIVDGKILAVDRDIKTDDDGYIEFSLPRGGVYDVHVHPLTDPSTVIFPIIVPDLAGARVEDVFFPYATQVDYDVNPLNVAVDEVGIVVVTITLSNGYQDTTDEIDGLLEFTSSDEDIATVEVSGGELQVTGVAAGTVTVAVARRSDAMAPRVPAVPALVVTPLQVEVS